MPALATSGLAISFGAIAGSLVYGLAAIIGVTLIVRVIVRLVRRKPVRDIVRPLTDAGGVQSRLYGFPPATEAQADAGLNDVPVTTSDANGADSGPFGEQRDALGPDPGEDQRR